ncbi:MAG: hypothetical protein QM535_18270 [Limnohabitans sp.]|nr:hypothetical protein [Limnohabitans sp.]
MLHKKIALITLQLFIGMFFISQSIIELGLDYYLVKPETSQHWISSFLGMQKIVAIPVLLLGLLITIGYKKKEMAILGVFVVLINHILFLFKDQFYNYTQLSFVLLMCNLLLYFFSPKTDNDKSFLPEAISKYPIDFSYASIRVFVGIISVFQGFFVLFLREKPLQSYVEGNYITVFKNSFLPDFLLWTMGYLNPFMLLIPGFFTVIGFKTKWMYYVSAFFFISLVFGHLVETPFFSDNMAYSGILCLINLVLLYFVEEFNRFSVDSFLKIKSFG